MQQTEEYPSKRHEPAATELHQSEAAHLESTSISFVERQRPTALYGYHNTALSIAHLSALTCSIQSETNAPCTMPHCMARKARHCSGSLFTFVPSRIYSKCTKRKFLKTASFSPPCLALHPDYVKNCPISSMQKDFQTPSTHVFSGRMSQFLSKSKLPSKAL